MMPVNTIITSGSGSATTPGKVDASDYKGVPTAREQLQQQNVITQDRQQNRMQFLEDHAYDTVHSFQPHLGVSQAGQQSKVVPDSVVEAIFTSALPEVIMTGVRDVILSQNSCETEANASVNVSEQQNVNPDVNYGEVVATPQVFQGGSNIFAVLSQLDADSVMWWMETVTTQALSGSSSAMAAKSSADASARVADTQLLAMAQEVIQSDSQIQSQYNTLSSQLINAALTDLAMVAIASVSTYFLCKAMSISDLSPEVGNIREDAAEIGQELQSIAPNMREQVEAAETAATAAQEKLATADTNAAEAQEAATKAQAAATEAQAAATEAQAAATEAQEKLATANTNAAEAKTAATEAQEKLATANTNAAEAKTAATEAQAAATEAQEKLATANTNAAEAQEAATEAETAATAAQEKLATANTNAAEAQEAATEAKTAATNARKFAADLKDLQPKINEIAKKLTTETKGFNLQESGADLVNIKKLQGSYDTILGQAKQANPLPANPEQLKETKAVLDKTVKSYEDLRTRVEGYIGGNGRFARKFGWGKEFRDQNQDFNAKLQRMTNAAGSKQNFVLQICMVATNQLGSLSQVAANTWTQMINSQYGAQMQKISNLVQQIMQEIGSLLQTLVQGEQGTSTTQAQTAQGTASEEQQLIQQLISLINDINQTNMSITKV